MKIAGLIIFVIISLSNCIVGQNKPNIILIMADDLGYEAFSMYGNDENVTPNLEKMAKNGMLFKNCHSTPLCTPSRVQIMTGKYNFRNYVGFGILDPQETTFGHLLKKEGYKTCVAGKWQLFGYEKQWKLAGGKKGSLPENAGFDHYRLWQIKELGSRYKNPRLHTKETGIKTLYGEYGPDLFVEYIENFMKESVDEPFFVYFPMVLTHDPFEPTPESPDFKEYNPEEKSNDPKYFPQMLEYLDHLIGRIVNATEALGVDENTLILFVGDNGTDQDVISSVNGEDVKGNKGNTNNFGTHVPLIAYWPGHIDPGSVNSNLIDFTDFVPTLLEVAGKDDQDKNPDMDGISFYPQLIGEDRIEKIRNWIFCHYDPNWGKRPLRRFVFNTDWKLYDNGEIFNLKEDLHELHPIQMTDLSRKQKKLMRGFQMVLNKMK